tara:strand:- start:728 stop:979 length:252 start_codon:yes stop_codon:yes gene_type:complete
MINLTERTAETVSQNHLIDGGFQNIPEPDTTCKYLNFPETGCPLAKNPQRFKDSCEKDGQYCKRARFLQEKEVTSKEYSFQNE